MKTCSMKLSGYWDEAVTFFKGFFNSTFKTNPYLKRGLITGITRISKESIFSDLTPSGLQIWKLQVCLRTW